MKKSSNIKKHLTEQQFYYWTQAQEQLEKNEKDVISAHLSSCNLCEERLELYEKYSTDVDFELGQAPSQEDKKLASDLVSEKNKTLDSANTFIDIYETQLKTYDSFLPGNLIRYFKHYPIRTITTIAAATVLGIFVFVTEPFKNDNPVYAEVENNILSTYNNKGEQLWSMLAEGIPDSVTSGDEWIKSEKHYIHTRVIDVDGDGNNEVLITGENYNSTFTRDTLYCYNGNGTLRWKTGTPTPVLFGEFEFTETDQWVMEEFFTVQSQSQKKPKFYSIGRAKRWFPGFLIELDPDNGTILQTYWHSGHFQSVTKWDYDNDGSESIVLGATNNAYDRAALIVLNPDSIEGHSPMTSEYIPLGIKRSAEQYYITIRPSDLNSKFSAEAYNSLPLLFLTDNERLTARTLETWSLLYDDVTPNIAIYYIFDKDFRVVNINSGDPLIDLYPKLFEEGKVSEPLTDQFWKTLKDSVLYWNGNKFVSQPTGVN